MKTPSLFSIVLLSLCTHFVQAQIFEAPLYQKDHSVNGVTTGNSAFAVGFFASAHGTASAAMGSFTTADSYACFVVGQANVGGGDPDLWDEEDPVFEVGIGTGDENDPLEEANRNALTVYKNGKIKMERQGDIPMGDFGSPE